MYNLDILTGETPTKATKEIFQNEKLLEATKRWQEIFFFQSKNEVFAFAELTVGQMLAMSKKNAQNALFFLFLTYNSSVPQGMDEKSTEILLQIVAKEEHMKAKKEKQTPTEKEEESLVISLAMMVKHLWFSWGDLLNMSISQFQMIAKNSEVIAGIKKPHDNVDNDNGDEMMGIERLKHIIW